MKGVAAFAVRQGPDATANSNLKNPKPRPKTPNRSPCVAKQSIVVRIQDSAPRHLAEYQILATDDCRVLRL